MNYSIVANDIINVDELISQIKCYVKKFQEYDDFFSHCKNVERFERNLKAQVPNESYQISQIYGSGRDLAISVPSHIYECLTFERTSLLKTAIDKLKFQLTYLKNWGESEHLRINEIYEKSEYNEWSVNHMLAKTLEMCDQLSEILILINIIKSSYSYQIQSGEMTMTEVRNLMRAEMNTVNNSGNFQNSQVSTGNNNSNTMTINQNTVDELVVICQKLIDIIDVSSAKTEEKDAVKAIVYEIKEAKNASSLKDAYNKLTSSMSNHITIGTAILSSNILPVLNQLIM